MRKTVSPQTAFRWGLLSTMLLQSGSAVTCILVPLADSGGLSSAALFWALNGVNLGSSLTGWLFCLPLPSLRSELLLLFWGLLGLRGLIRRRPLCLGLSCLFLGLELMGRAAVPLGQMPRVSRLLVCCASPALGLWVGILFAGLLQSSGAGMGALLALARAGSLSRSAALWLVMGLNIGTCSTAFLGAIPAGRRGRTVPLLHLSLNLGAALLTGLFLAVCPPAGIAAPWEIALFHTGFNLVIPLVSAFALTILRRPGMLKPLNRGRLQNDKDSLRENT